MAKISGKELAVEFSLADDFHDAMSTPVAEQALRTDEPGQPTVANAGAVSNLDQSLGKEISLTMTSASVSSSTRRGRPPKQARKEGEVIHPITLRIRDSLYRLLADVALERTISAMKGGESLYGRSAKTPQDIIIEILEQALGAPVKGGE